MRKMTILSLALLASAPFAGIAHADEYISEMNKVQYQVAAETFGGGANLAADAVTGHLNAAREIAAPAPAQDPHWGPSQDGSENPLL